MFKLSDAQNRCICQCTCPVIAAVWSPFDSSDMPSASGVIWLTSDLERIYVNRKVLIELAVFFSKLLRIQIIAASHWASGLPPQCCFWSSRCTSTWLPRIITMLQHITRIAERKVLLYSFQKIILCERNKCLLPNCNVLIPVNFRLWIIFLWILH